MPGRPGGNPAGGLFNESIVGPPPGPDTVGANAWIDLGVIPAGFRIWIGAAQYTSPDKTITFEIRTNNAGKSVGTEVDTTLLDAYSVSTRAGTVSRDFYRRGRLHITTVYGTGVEKWWLRLKSRSGVQGSYLYSIFFTKE